MKWTRRGAIAGIAGVGGAGLWTLHAGWPAAILSEHWSQPSPLGESGHSILGAAAERLLPGATVLGIPKYLSYWLARPPFDGVILKGFELGVKHLELEAERRYSKSFLSCEGARQDEILLSFQKGELKVRRFTGRGFFEQLMRLVIEGWLSHPKYGGNRDRAGWEEIGFDDAHCWWQAGALNDVHHEE